MTRPRKIASPPATALAAPEHARLFLALWPPASLQRALHRGCASPVQAPGASTVAAARLHVTLHFIGAVKRDHVDALAARLQVPMVPFELDVSRCTQWPRGLLVAAPDAAPDALTELHARLAEALRAAGCRVESRAFSPHLTLARRHRSPLPPPLPEPLRWTVRDYALVESRSAPRVEYVILRRYGA